MGLQGCTLGCFCLSSLLLSSGVTFAAGPVFPNVRHVIHISADGLGGLFLSDYLAQAPDDVPTFRRLITEGSTTLNARPDCDVSVTVPNHASMLTGRPVLQRTANKAPHGLTFNFDPGPFATVHALGDQSDAYKSSVLDVAHDNGFTTAFFAGKEKFAFFLRSYDEENGAPDLVGKNNGRAKIDASAIVDWTDLGVYLEKSADLVSLVVKHLDTATPGYTFLHLADPDVAGHYFGWGSENYRTAVRNVDRQLARILAAIEANPELRNRTAVIVTSDHGGGDVSGSHVYATDSKVFTIPFLVWSPGAVPAGRDLYELFSNRTEPGTQFVDYSANRQPLHNGDSGNLALAMLGLPAIPGSSLIPELKPTISATSAPTISVERPTISLERAGIGLVVSWPATSTIPDLERSDLASSVRWSKVTNGIVLVNGRYVYRETNSSSAPSQFFRLTQRVVR